MTKVKKQSRKMVSGVLNRQNLVFLYRKYITPLWGNGYTRKDLQISREADDRTTITVCVA